MSRSKSLLPSLLSLAVALSFTAQAGVTDADLVNANKITTGVLSTGIGSQGQRFSPLAKINTGNVAGLVPARLNINV